MQKKILLVSVLVICSLSACAPHSIRFGGCNVGICYEMGKLPLGWTSESSVEKQVFMGPEGRIVIQQSGSTIIEDAANEWIKTLNSIDYEKELREGQYSRLIYIKPQLANQNGEACFAVFKRIDGRILTAIGYPTENAELLCDIFDEAISSYTTDYTSVP